MDDELHFEFWRAIALTVMANAPPQLRRMIDEFDQVPVAESVRRLREWNNSTGYYLQSESANELVRHSIWRH